MIMDNQTLLAWSRESIYAIAGDLCLWKRFSDYLQNKIQQSIAPPSPIPNKNVMHMRICTFSCFTIYTCIQSTVLPFGEWKSWLLHCSKPCASCSFWIGKLFLNSNWSTFFTHHTCYTLVSTQFSVACESPHNKLPSSMNYRTTSRFSLYLFDSTVSPFNF